MKTALVTGGTTRLGAIIASGLRVSGWRVLTTSHRPDAGADFVCDFSDPASPDRLFKGLSPLLQESTNRRIDESTNSSRGQSPLILINNAALFVDSPEKVKLINLIAPRRLTELAAAAGFSAVINILDCRVLDGDCPRGKFVDLSIRRFVDSGKSDGDRPFEIYEETKRELLAATMEDARRFAGRMRVNAVAPGPVMAPVGVHEKAGDCPLGRPRPEDVAAAVEYFAEAEMVTGCVIPVDGGRRFT